LWTFADQVYIYKGPSCWWFYEIYFS
jgi:hypothetical protein